MMYYLHIMSFLLQVILILYLCLWLFEKFPILMTFCGILAQILHFIVLQDFPFVTLTSPAFILSLILITVNHYFAFTHFSSVFYSFSEVSNCTFDQVLATADSIQTLFTNSR